MKTRIQRAIAFALAAWRAGGESIYTSAELDGAVRERLDELTAAEALGLARGIAIREGERELAAALQAVLLIHLTGGPLASVSALVTPPQSSEAVN